METLKTSEDPNDLELDNKDIRKPLIEKGEDDQGNESCATSTSSEGEVSQILIVYMCITIVILDCSYGICAPLLPIDAEKHNIDQVYLGFMFCIYSVSMAIFCPIVGKHLYTFGRRNMCRWGMLAVAIPSLGFFLNNYTTNSTLFIVIFMVMRVIQGIGTSMVQTSVYSVLTLTYPTRVNFVMACVETSAGLGLSLGPVMGTILYEFGGSAAPFLTFFFICLFIGLVIKSLIPYFVDDIQDNSTQDNTVKPKYSELLTNKRILFSCMCVFISVFQYAFIDPILAEYVKDTFNLAPQTSGYFFLALGLGYMISCIISPMYSKIVFQL